MSQRRQIDPGTYNLHQGATQVGTCFVQPGPQLDSTIEHWVLFPSFDSPRMNSASPPAAIDNLTLEAIPSASNTYGTWSTGSQFRSVMRTYVQNNSSVQPVRYIRCVRTDYEGIPFSL